MKHTYLLTSIFFVICHLNAFSQWTDTQNASIVIGQSNFTNNSSATTATTLNASNVNAGVAVDVTNNKLYVSDGSNNRILRYSLPIASSQPTAERVFGQADFTSGSANRGGACASNTLSNAIGIAVDATGRLWVADAGNNRILWFNTAHSQGTDGVAANGVLGQANFTSTSSGITAATLNLPSSVSGFIAGLTISSSGALYISDSNNNRILRFDNASSKSNGANADGVLGQANFTSNSSGTTSTTLYTPAGISIVGSTMYVADLNNNRVLRFDSPASASNGQAANGVLGQANFTSSSGWSYTQSSMTHPTGVAIDGTGRLYVVDLEGIRVLIYNSASSKANGANADNVLGQANFTTNTQSTTQSGLYYPSGVAVDATNARLYVADGGAARVMRYNASSALPVLFSAFDAKVIANGVIVNWTTTQELNNDHFELERSHDGINFDEITEIKGQGIKSTQTIYNYLDKEVNTILPIYYRLKQVDYDGKFEYSPVVFITGAEENYKTSIYPNPLEDGTTLYARFGDNDEGIAKISLFDLSGKLINDYLLDNIKPSTIHPIEDKDLHLPKGEYILQIKTLQNMYNQKLIVK